jgi:hypothetical protein
MKIARQTSSLALAFIFVFGGVLNPFVRAFASGTEEEQRGDAPSLTIYNQRFAVVRQRLSLDLKSGLNHMQVIDITAHLEPDSVILRPLDTGRHLQILEQNYRNDPVTQQLLLSLYEGKTIDFVQTDKDGNSRVVQGKIIRSGYVPHYAAYNAYGQQYFQQQAAYAQGGGEQPVIEVNGKLQFSLPGQPVFPALAADTVLKPTLSWELQTDKPGATTAEFSYVTGGMNWEASYNVVAPPKGNVLELVGWVTLDNQSGRTFRDARIKLMAGDVNKVQPPEVMGMASAGRTTFGVGVRFGPPMQERTFDEYHLYTLEHSTTLHDRETKQVEMVRASGIQSKTVYVYDGFKVDQNYQNWTLDNIRQQESYGILSNPKVWVIEELKNSNENHLGMPLPKGRVRFYRRDDDGQLEFTGENDMDHTAKDETIRLYTGNAFDMTGERNRTEYRADFGARWIDESFEIKVRNHKSAPVEVRVVEHLYRWTSWDIVKNSDPFKKLDSQTVEFLAGIPSGGEKTLTYKVHYSW